MAWTKFKSMEYDDEDSLDAPMPIAMLDKPQYPYGLRICLTDKELTKAGIAEDCDAGDTIELLIRAKVTSKTVTDSDDGHCARIELQITDIATMEGGK